MIRVVHLKITGSNIHLFSKSVNYLVQEELNEISFSRFLEQVDSKIRRLHLLLFEYATRVEEWNDSIQEEGAGGLEFHLGH